MNIRTWPSAWIVIVCALVVGSSNPVQAQGFGLRSGAHVNPDQFSVGGQYELGTAAERLWLQTSADLGFGDNAFLTSLNFDLMYRRPIVLGTLTAFAGGGPALNFYRLPDYSVTEPGLNLAGGLMHPSGWFSEVRLGFFESPQLRFGAGYRFQSGGRPGATPPGRPAPRAPRR